MRTRILLLVPGAYTSSGGIQAYSRELIEVLARHPHISLHVVSKNDLPEDLPKNENMYIRGTGRHKGAVRTAAFCLHTLKSTFVQRPDVVISMLTSFSPLQLFVRTLTGAKTAVVGHGIEVWHLKRYLERRMWKRTDYGVPVSSYTKERLMQQGLLETERAHIIPSCFDEDRFSIQDVSTNFMERYKIQPGREVILSVGRVSSGEGYKGCDQILTALHELKRRRPAVYYIHAGSGDDLDRLRARVTEEGLSDFAQFAGFVPDEDLPQLFNVCSLFCMPSTGEGFGIVFVEALACGKPVIISDSGGSLDLLHKDLPVVAVSPDDQERLIQSIDTSLDKSKNIHREEIRNITCERYGKKRFASAWYALLSLEEEAV